MDYEHVSGMKFLKSFSGQLIFNKYELIEFWSHNSLWNEPQAHYVLHANISLEMCGHRHTI